MTDFDQHHPLHPPYQPKHLLMKSSIRLIHRRPSFSNNSNSCSPSSMSNEFYDSAIELSADDYSTTTTATAYQNSTINTAASIHDPFCPNTSSNHNHHHQIDHCGNGGGWTAKQNITSFNRLVNSNSNLNPDDNRNIGNQSSERNMETTVAKAVHPILNRSKLNGNDSKITSNNIRLIPQSMDQIDASSMFRSLANNSIESKSRQPPPSTPSASSSLAATVVHQDHRQLYGEKIGSDTTMSKHYRCLKPHQTSTSTALNAGHIKIDQQRQQVVSNVLATAATAAAAAASSSTGSLLRSSRSFTARLCPRPNVTLIRRKSASERLAESKSKYIRVPKQPPPPAISSSSSSSLSAKVLPDEETSTKSSTSLIDHQQQRLPEADHNVDDDDYDDRHFVDIDEIDDGNNYDLDGNMNHHKLLLRSSSQKINILSNENHNNHNSLVSKINSHLNRRNSIVCGCSPPCSSSNGCNLVKKRISPKISEDSHGGSVLELQLRELISLDPVASNVGDDTKPPVDIRFVPLAEVDSKDIYRAELKYIASSSSSSSSSSASSSSSSSSSSSCSSSSSSSIFSEPYNVSSSPEKMKRFPNLNEFESNNQRNLNLKKRIETVPPSIGARPNCQDSNNPGNISIVRSKSDVGGDKNRIKNNMNGNDIGRFLESLCIDSNQVDDEKNQYSVGKSSSNLPNHKTISSSIDSLEKLEKFKIIHQPQQQQVSIKPSLNHHHRLIQTNVNQQIYSGYHSTTRSSTNEFSSLDSSTQFSVDDSPFTVNHHHFHGNDNRKHLTSKNQRTGSASKLTFKNLMLHQQNLASSRSCNNLLMNLHNGSSVVERNARIIKWLFNCRKAMDQSTII